MLSITKQNNSLLVKGENHDFFPYDGQITVPLNSLILVLDDSNMTTFRSAENYDVLFSGLIKDIIINEQSVTKETIADAFSKIANAPSGGSGSGGYAAMRELNPYLFDAYYSNLDYDKASKWFDENAPAVVGGCTSIRKGSLMGRNFDWFYDKNAEFAIHTSGGNGRFKTIGVGGNLTGLTSDFVRSREKSDLYDILPFMVADIMNEHGVSVSVNVVPNVGTKTNQNVEWKRRMNALMIPRYVADHFTNASDACDAIADFNIYMPANQELHFLVADREETYLIEFIDNETVITELEDNPFITNFRMDGVEITEGELDWSTVEQYGMGLERFQYILDNYSTETVGNILSNLYYDNAYTKELDAEDFWKTEFCVKDSIHDFTINTPVTDEAFASYITAAKELYANRDRDGKTWLTEHQSIYDLENLTLKVKNQIGVDGYGTTEYSFEISVGGYGTMDYNELENKPTLNGEELIGNVEIDIPTKTSDLTNDSGFISSESDPVFSASAAAGITASDIAGWDAKSDFSGDYEDLTNKPTIPDVYEGRLLWSLHEYSAELFKNGTNISSQRDVRVSYCVTTTGDVTSSGSATYNSTYNCFNFTLESSLLADNPSFVVVSFKVNGNVVATECFLNNYGIQGKLTSGTNIKTINGSSILGSGDLEVEADLSNYYTKAEIDAMIGTINDSLQNIIGGNE